MRAKLIFWRRKAEKEPVINGFPGRRNKSAQKSELGRRKGVKPAFWLEEPRLTI